MKLPTVHPSGYRPLVLRSKNAAPTALLFACVLILLASGCSRQPVESPLAVPCVVVQTVAPSQHSITAWSGVVRMPAGVELGFTVPGRIQGIYAEIGDRVDAGSILMEMDPEPFRLQLQQAEAEEQAALPALAEAKRRKESEERLWAAGATSKADHDAAMTAYANAQARLASASAAQSLAARALRETRLRAPADGLVAKRLVSTGAVVQAGLPVIAFDPAGQAEVVLLVSSSCIESLEVGQKVRVQFRLTSSAPHFASGEITHVGRRSLAGGVHEVLVRLPTGVAVHPGEAVLACFRDEASSGAVAVPSTAVHSSGDGSARVFVVAGEGDRVESRVVHLGAPSGSNILVSSGLRIGERVVVRGGAFLRDGQSVRTLGRQ